MRGEQLDGGSQTLGPAGFSPPSTTLCGRRCKTRTLPDTGGTAGVGGRRVGVGGTAIAPERPRQSYRTRLQDGCGRGSMAAGRIGDMCGCAFCHFCILQTGGAERASGSVRLLGTGRGSSCTALCRLSSRWQTKAEHNDSQYAYLLFACLGCVTCVLLRAIGGLDRKLAVLGIRRDVDVGTGVGG